MQNTIGKTIESILSQDYSNKEIIVINDGSNDNTEEILKTYPIKFITSEKLGISNARNLGYVNSNGNFVAFTDADCELDPLWTKNMLKGFIDEGVGLVGGRTIFRTNEHFSSIYRSIEFSKRYKNIKNDEVVWAGGPGSMFRREILDELGGFNPDWVHGEDAEISFLTVEHGYKVSKKDDAITYHVPETGFWRLVRKGYRDSKAYVRATKSHLKTSIKNKFNTTWYFPYDMILLPLLYAFILLSSLFLPFLYFINFYINLPSWISFCYSLWLWVFVLTELFLLIYGLIPSFQVAVKSKSKIHGFLGTSLLHHTRGFAWGLGLLVGFKNIIFRKF